MLQALMTVLNNYLAMVPHLLAEGMIINLNLTIGRKGHLEILLSHLKIM